MAVVIVNGSQGSGKSAISRTAAELYGCRVGEISDLMFKRLHLEHGLTSRDDLRSVPWAANVKTFLQVTKKFLDDCDKDLGIFVVHTFPRRKAGVYYPMPFHCFRGKGFSLLVTLITAPHIILSRRKHDVQRNRAAATMEMIEEEQELYVLSASIVATQLEIPHYVLPNPEDAQEDTTRTLIHLARRHQPERSSK